MMKGLVKMIAYMRCTREWKKYCVLLWILNYLHYYWAASKPSLHYHKTPIMEKLLAQCSLLVNKYHPTWYLFNGHMQTIFLAFGNKKPAVEYCREHVHLSDGGLVSLDWVVSSNSPHLHQSHNCPTILLLHGNCGGSWENYIRKAAHELFQEGWRVVVMNARGCAKTPVLTPRLFNAADTDDIRQVVLHLRRKHVPTARLLAVGFSLGSNLLVKYLGQEGEACPLDAAVSVGNPFDAMKIFQHLHHSSVLTHYLYYRTMTRKFLKLFFEESDVHQHFVDHPSVCMDSMKSCATMWEVDHAMTMKVFGYDSVHEYYEDCSCAPYIPKVRIPLLCLSAHDDPVCVHTAIPFEACAANKNVLLAVTHRGGHLGFFTGNDVFEYPQVWSVQVVAQFCDAIDRVLDEPTEFSPRPVARVPVMPPPSPMRTVPRAICDGEFDDELVLCEGVPVHQVFSLSAALASACLVYSKVDFILGRRAWWSS